ncbi:MAG TPA: M13 family metallopeptidase [Puia sp.]|nr:M13 family metallopeptidase [Puia sp.]
MSKFLRHSVLLIFILPIFSFDPPKKKSVKFIDKANMDLSIKPGDNFYLYVNANWLKRNPVPASKTRWGSFDQLRELSTERIHSLLEEATTKTSLDRLHQMVGDYYTSGMDSLNLEQFGYDPIKPDLQRIDGIMSLSGLLDEVAYDRVHALGTELFGFSISQDSKNVNAYIPHFSQGGTSLPDRDYYLKNDRRSTRVREAYLRHLKNMFHLIGADDAATVADADAVMRIETALAKSQLSRTEMRDPDKTYNKFSVKDFTTMTPSLDWKAILMKFQVVGADSIVTNNPSFFRSADLLVGALPLQDWKIYLKWKVLSSAAPYLSKAFIDEDFTFAQVLSGQKEQTPRWQRMSNLIDRQLGDFLGQLYVARYFKPEAKQRMQDLVNNMVSTFSDRIKKLDWMSAETKTKALEKLDAITKKIAYPDKWKEYEGVTIDKKDLLGNTRRCEVWAYNDMVSRFGKPVDKTRWGMTPPTINAYYQPTNNEIVFPAGILQYPFFDFAADDAVNYGGIAAVIGHEMTHGFDDEGRKYAADGNLKDWWTKDDAAKFTKKANEVVEQYSAFTVLDTLHVNGKLTLGENLADLGGLSIAYEAFTKTPQFKEGKKIDGFTPAQRFFINWAQVWRTNILPETASQLVLTDSHSPGMYRANAPLENIDAWYQAFDVKPGDKMYKSENERTKIW